MMIKWLLKAIIRFCEEHNKYWVITGRPREGNKKEVPYLIRYFVFRSKLFSVYIHRFLRSDLDTLHNHPWDFASYLVEGAYKEHTLFGVNERTDYKNQFVFRRASDFHRVEIDGFYTFDEREKAPLTLFFHGRYKQDWGFLITNTLYQSERPVIDDVVWVPWWKYLGIPKENERNWE